MKHTEKIASTKVYHTCDICGRRRSTKQCPGCGRDVCNKCGDWWYSDPWTGDNNGDYPPRVCDRCDKKVGKYAQLAQEIQLEADGKIEELQAAWLRECRLS